MRYVTWGLVRCFAESHSGLESMPAPGLLGKHDTRGIDFHGSVNPQAPGAGGKSQNRNCVSALLRNLRKKRKKPNGICVILLVTPQASSLEKQTRGFSPQILRGDPPSPRKRLSPGTRKVRIQTIAVPFSGNANVPLRGAFRNIIPFHGGW